MLDSRVGKRYAVALYDLAAEKGGIMEVYNTINLVMETFLGNQEFKTLISHPLVGKEEKKEFVKKIFSTVENFHSDIIEYLIEKNRLVDIKEIVTEYLKLYYANNQMVDVIATLAQEPSKEQRKSLIEKVEKRTGKKVELTIEIDSSIIGGGILKIGDEIIDGSIKRQLETLWKK